MLCIYVSDFFIFLVCCICGVSFYVYVLFVLVYCSNDVESIGSFLCIVVRLCLVQYDIGMYLYSLQYCRCCSKSGIPTPCSDDLIGSSMEILSFSCNLHQTKYQPPNFKRIQDIKIVGITADPETRGTNVFGVWCLMRACIFWEERFIVVYWVVWLNTPLYTMNTIIPVLVYTTSTAVMLKVFT